MRRSSKLIPGPDAFLELLAQSRLESAYFVVARRGNYASAPFSSARRCAISRRSQLGHNQLMGLLSRPLSHSIRCR